MDEEEYPYQGEGEAEDTISTGTIAPEDRTNDSVKNSDALFKINIYLINESLIRGTMRSLIKKTMTPVASLYLKSNV